MYCGIVVLCYYEAEEVTKESRCYCYGCSRELFAAFVIVDSYCTIHSYCTILPSRCFFLLLVRSPRTVRLILVPIFPSASVYLLLLLFCSAPSSVLNGSFVTVLLLLCFSSSSYCVEDAYIWGWKRACARMIFVHYDNDIKKAHSK